MGIKVTLPEGEGPRTGMGTKIYTSDGVEITGVSDISISIQPDSFITAKITVCVDELANFHAILPSVTHSYTERS